MALSMFVNLSFDENSSFFEAVVLKFSVSGLIFLSISENLLLLSSYYGSILGLIFLSIS